MTWVLYETKMFISIYHLSMVHHVELFLKCIERHWFMASRAKKKIHDFQKLKTFKRWFHLNFHRAKKKKVQMVSHHLWAQKRKIVFHKNWNPLAWKCVYQMKLFTNLNLKQGGVSPCMYHWSLYQFELWHLPCAEGWGTSNHTKIAMMARG